MVLLVLAVLWAVVLVPPVLRARAEALRRDHERGAEAVRRELALVAAPGDDASSEGEATEPPAPRVAPALATGSPVARALSSAVQRRRRGLVALLAGSATTFLAGLVGSASDQASLSWIWAVHVSADLLVVGYLVALAVAGWLRRHRPEEETNVHYLPNRQEPVVPVEQAAPLRSSASS